MIEGARYITIENVLTYPEGYEKQVFLNYVDWDKKDLQKEYSCNNFFIKCDRGEFEGHFIKKMRVHTMSIPDNKAMFAKEEKYKIWTADEVAFVDAGYSGDCYDRLRDEIVHWHHERLKKPHQKRYNFLHNPRFLMQTGTKYQQVGHDLSEGYLFVPTKYLKNKN